MSRLQFLQLIQGTNSSSILKIVLLLAFIGYMSYAVVRPIVKGNEKKAETVRLTQLVKVKQAEKHRLQQRKDWLSSPQGINSIAHEKGMVGPNEESVRFQPQKPQDPMLPAAPAKPAKYTVIGEIILVGLFLLALAVIGGIAAYIHRWRVLRAQQQVGVLTPRSELRRRRRHAPHEA